MRAVWLWVKEDREIWSELEFLYDELIKQELNVCQIEQ